MCEEVIKEIRGSSSRINRVSSFAVEKKRIFKNFTVPTKEMLVCVSVHPCVCVCVCLCVCVCVCVCVCACLRMSAFRLDIYVSLYPGQLPLAVFYLTPLLFSVLSRQGLTRFTRSPRLSHVSSAPFVLMCP